VNHLKVFLFVHVSSLPFLDGCRLASLGHRYHTRRGEGEKPGQEHQRRPALGIAVGAALAFLALKYL
jgi:hypothetical protein